MYRESKIFISQRFAINARTTENCKFLAFRLKIRMQLFETRLLDFNCQSWCFFESVGFVLQNNKNRIFVQHICGFVWNKKIVVLYLNEKLNVVAIFEFFFISETIS